MLCSVCLLESWRRGFSFVRTCVWCRTPETAVHTHSPCSDCMLTPRCLHDHHVVSRYARLTWLRAPPRSWCVRIVQCGPLSKAMGACLIPCAPFLSLLLPRGPCSLKQMIRERLREHGWADNLKQYTKGNNFTGSIIYYTTCLLAPKHSHRLYCDAAPRHVRCTRKQLVSQRALLCRMAPVQNWLPAKANRSPLTSSSPKSPPAHEVSQALS